MCSHLNGKFGSKLCDYLPSDYFWWKRTKRRLIRTYWGGAHYKAQVRKYFDEIFFVVDWKKRLHRIATEIAGFTNIIFSIWGHIVDYILLRSVRTFPNKNKIFVKNIEFIISLFGLKLYNWITSCNQLV